MHDVDHGAEVLEPAPQGASIAGSLTSTSGRSVIAHSIASASPNVPDVVSTTVASASSSPSRAALRRMCRAGTIFINR